ncbi:hypothetical protein TURU_127882 [Turdus rufiventris]|nr:hypothetical protein TURU_127882 [Turdus rufiventris]
MRSNKAKCQVFYMALNKPNPVLQTGNRVAGKLGGIKETGGPGQQLGEHETAVYPGGQEGQWIPRLDQKWHGQQDQGSDRHSPVIPVPLEDNMLIGVYTCSSALYSPSQTISFTETKKGVGMTYPDYHFMPRRSLLPLLVVLLKLNEKSRGFQCCTEHSHDSENVQLPVDPEVVRDLLLQLDPYWFGESREIPAERKVDDIVLIFKKGKNPGNDRPVSLTSVPGSYGKDYFRRTRRATKQVHRRYKISTILKFSMGKCQILYLAWGNPECSLGNEMLESSATERDPRTHAYSNEHAEHESALPWQPGGPPMS